MMPSFFTPGETLQQTSVAITTLRPSISFSTDTARRLAEPDTERHLLQRSAPQTSTDLGEKIGTHAVSPYVDCPQHQILVGESVYKTHSVARKWGANQPDLQTSVLRTIPPIKRRVLVVILELSGSGLLERKPISVHFSRPAPKRKRSGEPDEYGTIFREDETTRVRHRALIPSRVEDRRGSDIGSIDPIRHWLQEGNWPLEYFQPDGPITQPITEESSVPSGLSEVVMAPHKEEMFPTVRSGQYEKHLADFRIHMDQPKPELSLKAIGATLCRQMLDAEQPIPRDSLFENDLFLSTCQVIRNRNEAQIIQDISRLIVPSAQQLARRGAKYLEHLVDMVDVGWSQAIPLVPKRRPRPDFSVGLKPTAFTATQRRKLEPYVGGGKTASRLIATCEMYFPFLTVEVKCGNEGLNIADRQNAHSASIAANAVVDLYRGLSRQHELHRELLAFSISHDHRTVRVYGHYALIDGRDASFYIEPVTTVDITSEHGKKRWTVYKFTRSVYDMFVPLHPERICSVVDQLPDPEVLEVERLSALGDA